MNGEAGKPTVDDVGLRFADRWAYAGKMIINMIGANDENANDEKKQPQLAEKQQLGSRGVVWGLLGEGFRPNVRQYPGGRDQAVGERAFGAAGLMSRETRKTGGNASEFPGADQIGKHVAALNVLIKDFDSIVSRVISDHQLDAYRDDSDTRRTALTVVQEAFALALYDFVSVNGVGDAQSIAEVVQNIARNSEKTALFLRRVEDNLRLAIVSTARMTARFRDQNGHDQIATHPLAKPISGVLDKEAVLAAFAGQFRSAIREAAADDSVEYKLPEREAA